MVLHRLLGALVGLAHDACGLGVRLRDQPLLLLDRPVGLLHLLREVEAEVVDQLHHLVLVDHDLGREGDETGVVHQVLDAVEDLVDLQLNFSLRRAATSGGTNSLTSRPWLAMSLRILDDTNM